MYIIFYCILCSILLIFYRVYNHYNILLCLYRDDCLWSGWRQRLCLTVYTHTRVTCESSTHTQFYCLTVYTHTRVTCESSTHTQCYSLTVYTHTRVTCESSTHTQCYCWTIYTVHKPEGRVSLQHTNNVTVWPYKHTPEWRVSLWLQHIYTHINMHHHIFLHFLSVEYL